MIRGKTFGGRERVRVVRSEGEGIEEEEGPGGGVGCRCVRQRAAEALSVADRDTFAPELWNCVV